MATEKIFNQPSALGVPSAYLSLFALTIQNTVLTLIMHWSRIMPLVGGHRYYASTAVLLAEIGKFALSLTMVLYDESINNTHHSIPSLFGHVSAAIFSRDWWKLAIPAALYYTQNSMQFIALSHLDAPTFQTTSQLKIFTTAVFGLCVLGKPLTTRKWLSLVLLIVGIITIQFPNGGIPTTVDDLRAASKLEAWSRSGEYARYLGKRALQLLVPRSATYQGMHEDAALHNPRLDSTIGLIAVLVTSTAAGIGGVYVEKVLKETAQGEAVPSSNKKGTSVWIRNVQLSFYSSFPALLLGVVFTDGGDIARNGFFAGYNHIVWITIGLQITGGLLVALTITYADAMVKNLATSASIVLSFFVSLIFFNLETNFPYVLGSAIVLFAAWLHYTPEMARSHELAPLAFDRTPNSREQQMGYFDDVEPKDSLKSHYLSANQGHSTSRPGSRPGSRAGSPGPGMPHERYHFRTGSGRRALDKRK